MNSSNRTYLYSLDRITPAEPTESRSLRSRGLSSVVMRLGIDRSSPESLLRTLPFAGDDTTSGSESELQAAVIGTAENVDLPRTVRHSNYYANLLRRARSGDLPHDLVSALEEFIGDNQAGVWENSWVCFNVDRLDDYALGIFRNDLRADKGDPSSRLRNDTSRFLSSGSDRGTLARVPISYLIKLSMSDALGRQKGLPAPIFETGAKMLGHFLNDNTSPETFSFHVVPQNRGNGNGLAIARETSRRFLLTQALVQYANRAFGLEESGQKAMIYFAPHPPERQKELNGIIPDNFYRSLFMSPCLSGWDRGEDKSDYMHLCHQVLSRSQLNAVAKLKEAGIIVNNLVVLPNVSNTSLANNGTHISLGSRRLSGLLESGDLNAADEKLLGDLAVKIAEHFMPLFVGTYSAAPYRLGFEDFHPERVLGFLPHQLDYTHLRMLWRRWRKKADLSVFGRSVTPFGPHRFDRIFSRVFGLSGDFVPDFRLIDYPVWLLSTDRSPASDGRLDNHERLKSDLADMGIFDPGMSLYLVYKMREFRKMGFSGFEGRHYSLFADFRNDMGHAASLQQLVTALAFKYMVNGAINHRQVPDDPVLESERRQMFFSAAAGVPTFYVRINSRNILLRRILRRTEKIRASRRYTGYWRVLTVEYQKALLRTIREDGGDLVDMMDMDDTLRDLEMRINDPSTSTFGKLTRGILDHGKARDPLRESAGHFNRSAEDYYRGRLRLSHLNEGLEDLLESLEQVSRNIHPVHAAAFRAVFGEVDPVDWLKRVRSDFLHETLPTPELRRLVMLLVILINTDTVRAAQSIRGETANASASVY